MIFSNVHIQSLLLATPAFALFFAFCWRFVKSREICWQDFIILLIVLIFPLSCLGIGYLLEKSMVWTGVYVCCAVVAGGTMLLAIISWDFFDHVPAYVFLGGTAACLIFLIVSVPVAIMPTFRASPALPDQTQFDSAVLERTVEAIADKFASFEQALLKEQEKMSQSFDNLIIEVKNQDAKVDNLRRRKSELEQQVAKYQEILSLSEDQIRSIESLLKQDRHIDYIIGFFLGLVSSGLIALSGFAFKRMRKHEM